MTIGTPSMLALVAALSSSGGFEEPSSIAKLAGTPASDQAEQTGPVADGASGSTNDQGAAGDSSAIVVTARRREERIADVPAAVDVLGAQAIADRGGFVTLQDLAINTPSVNFADTSTPSTAEISIRGSGTARATNAEGGVGLYRNGTYVGGGRLGGRSFTRMDFFDLERIEVVRGVQSALYGRNAIGGSLNLLNVQPQFRDTGNFRIGYGEHNRAEFQGVLNLALSENVAVRIGGDLMEQGQGAFFNPVKREYFDEQRARGLRGQIRVRTGILDANLLLEASKAKLPPLIFSLAIPVGSAGFPRGAFQDPYNVGWNGDSVAEQRQKAAILDIKLDLPFGTWTNVISLRKRETDHGFDGDGLDPVFLAQLRAQGGGLNVDPGLVQLQQDSTETVYIGSYLADKGTGPLSWLMGYEHLDIRSDSLFTALRTATVANPSPGTRSPTELDTVSNAVYASLGYDLTDRLTVNGEIRYTRESKSLIANRFDIRTGASSGPRFAINSAAKDNNVSYTLVASYKLAAIDGLIYVRHGTGFRAGGFNNDLGDPRAPNPVVANFDGEEATAYEIGIKGRLLRGLRFAVTAFQTDTSDALFQDTNGCRATLPSCPVAETVFLRNGGESRVRGGELQLDGRFRLAGGTLGLSGSVSRIDAEILTGRDAGRQVPQAPDWTFNAGLNYVAPITSRTDGFVNLQYFSRRGGVQEISQVPPLVDFYRINYRAGLRREGMELALFIDNLTDERYSIFSTSTLQRTNYPRSWGVQFSKRWR